MGKQRNLCAEAIKTSLTDVEGMHQYSINILEIVQRWGVRERWGGGGFKRLRLHYCVPETNLLYDDARPRQSCRWSGKKKGVVGSHGLAYLSCLTIEQQSFSECSTVSCPVGDTLHIWALISLLPYITLK